MAEISTEFGAVFDGQALVKLASAERAVDNSEGMLAGSVGIAADLLSGCIQSATLGLAAGEHFEDMEVVANQANVIGVGLRMPGELAFDVSVPILDVLLPGLRGRVSPSVELYPVDLGIVVSLPTYGRLELGMGNRPTLYGPDEKKIELDDRDSMKLAAEVVKRLARVLGGDVSLAGLEGLQADLTLARDRRLTLLSQSQALISTVAAGVSNVGLDIGGHPEKLSKGVGWASVGEADERLASAAEAMVGSLFHESLIGIAHAGDLVRVGLNEEGAPSVCFVRGTKLVVDISLKDGLVLKVSDIDGSVHSLELDNSSSITEAEFFFGVVWKFVESSRPS